MSVGLAVLVGLLLALCFVGAVLAVVMNRIEKINDQLICVRGRLMNIEGETSNIKAILVNADKAAVRK